jgi:acyl carrier protein
MITDDAARIEGILKQLIARTTKKADVKITPDSTFKELGVDSLEVVHILVALEDTLGIDINDKDLTRIHNMGAFIEYLSQKVASNKADRRRHKPA